MTRHRRRAAAGPPPAGASSKTTPGTDPAAEPPSLALRLNVDLIERRKTIRTLPVPEVTESDSEESWSTWLELSAQQDKAVAKESAVAKLRALIRSAGAAAGGRRH